MLRNLFEKLINKAMKKTEAYFKHFQLSMMECFYKNSEQFLGLTIYLFILKRALSFMFDSVPKMTLK